MFKEPLIKINSFSGWEENCKAHFGSFVKDYRVNGKWVDLCSISQTLAPIQSSLLVVRLCFNQLDDHLVWTDEPSGNYSISSAFARVTSSEGSPPFWSKAWLKHLIPKINIFF